MGFELDKRLLADGWERRFTASGSRLQEAIEEYIALGFEVKTIPVSDLQGNGCTICFENENDRSEMIYTRPSSNPQSDGLF
jgi:hypothetical protein